MSQNSHDKKKGGGEGGGSSMSVHIDNIIDSQHGQCLMSEKGHQLEDNTASKSRSS